MTSRGRERGRIFLLWLSVLGFSFVGVRAYAEKGNDDNKSVNRGPASVTTDRRIASVLSEQTRLDHPELSEKRVVSRGAGDKVYTLRGKVTGKTDISRGVVQNLDGNLSSQGSYQPRNAANQRNLTKSANSGIFAGNGDP